MYLVHPFMQQDSKGIIPYLCDDDSMVDLVKDVHSDLVLPTNLQHPVVAGGDGETYTRKNFKP